MYTLHSKIKPNGEIEALPKVGATVKLLADSGSEVTFESAGGDVKMLPSHEFYGTYRQASTAEMEKFAKGANANAAA